MKQTSIINAALKVTLVSVVALQFACSSSTSTSSDPADVSISGIITAAPVSASDVSVVDGGGNVVAGPATTNASGEYSLSIPVGSLAQDLIIKSTGGVFVDEATGNIGTAGEMVAYVAANSLSNGSSVSATPGSSIIANLVMNHNKTMVQAQDAFKNAFGYTPDVSVTPADATTAPAVDETDAATLAGFRAAAFSQLAMDMGLSQNDQFEMFAALAQDLSDDKLDGVDASGAVAIGSTGTSLEVDIQNRFAVAMVNFSNNPNNLTELDNNEFGDIPFAKVALTSTYQIEYIQTGMMGPVNGKDTFQIHVTNRSDGTDATGLTSMLMPMMYMLGDHKHSTPMAAPAITEDIDGLYTVTLYYLMPTAMGGYWDLKLMVSGEEAHFYPTVMMAMGDTSQVRLKGVDDKFMSMMTNTMVSRTYFIYKDSLTGDMGSYDFSVFVASQESMMSFPALITDLILNEGNMMSELAIDCPTIEVSVSVNGGAYNPATSDCTDGIWTINLTLDDGMGVENQVRVKLTVNGEVKTTDGFVIDPDVNDFQTFIVTPNPSMDMM